MLITRIKCLAKKLDRKWMDIAQRFGLYKVLSCVLKGIRRVTLLKRIYSPGVSLGTESGFEGIKGCQ